MAELTKVDYGIKKYCPICGSRMYAKMFRSSGRMESRWKFEQRTFCSYECTHKGIKGRKYKVIPDCTPGMDCFSCPYPDCMKPSTPMTHTESIMRKCGELPEKEMPEEEPASCTIAEIHLDINIEVTVPREGYYE